MKSVSNKKALVEISSKYSDRKNGIILEAYLIGGSLKVGDTIEYQNERAKVCKYNENYDFYSLSCNRIGAFAKALGNIITVAIRQ